MRSVDATSVYNSLVQDLTFGGVALPFIGQAALGLVRVRYWFWWCSSRKKEVMQSNAAELGFGLLLNFSIHNEKIRAASKIFLLIIRIERCIDQFRQLLIECEQLNHAIRGHYSYVEVKWIASKNKGMLSAGYIHDLKCTYLKMNQYINNISFCALRILRRLDKLLMHSIDAYEALHADNEAMIMSITNASAVLKRVCENPVELFMALDARKIKVEKCMSLFVSGDPKEKTDQLMDALKDTLEDGHNLYRNYQSVSSSVGEISMEIVADISKRMLFGIAHTFNVANHIPSKFIPEPEHIVRARIFADHLDQFPPLNDTKGKIENGSTELAK